MSTESVHEIVRIGLVDPGPVFTPINNVLPPPHPLFVPRHAFEIITRHHANMYRLFLVRRELLQQHLVPREV